MIIQVFTEKHFSSNFWSADILNMVDPFFSFWEIYILIIHWWPICVPKTSNGVECCSVMPHDVFFLKLMKSCWSQQKNHMKSGQTHNIWKQQHNRFPMWSIHSNQRSGSEVRAIQKFEIGRLTSAKNSGIPYETLPLFPPPPPPPLQVRKICDIARKCVKLNLKK